MHWLLSRDRVPVHLVQKEEEPVQAVQLSVQERQF